MPQYKITFRQDWLEYGTTIIEADSEEKAMEIAETLDDAFIEWESDNMDPQGRDIEDCEEIE